jgi:hypothetical protein
VRLYACAVEYSGVTHVVIGGKVYQPNGPVRLRQEFATAEEAAATFADMREGLATGAAFHLLHRSITW